MYYLLFIPIFFAILLGGISFYTPTTFDFDPNNIASQTIITTAPEKSLGTMGLTTFSVHTEFIPTPTTTPVPPVPQQPPQSTSGLGSHGAFNIYTPDEATKAHTAGVTYNIIDYWGSNRTSAQQDDPAKPSTAVGKALLGYGMKTIMNLSGCDIIGAYVTGGGNSCNGTGRNDGSIYLNEALLTQRVKAVYNNGNNPLLGGYWIKDDDTQICNDGEYSAPMTAKLQRSYQLIRQIDPNPNHVIIAGFCVAADLRKNYHPTATQPIADVVATYPYPNLYGFLFTGGSGNMNTEVAAEVATVKANTPVGKSIPPLLGIYQGFWSTCHIKNGIKYHCPGGIAAISNTTLINNAKTFMNNGFAGLIDFAFEAEDVDHTGGNDSGMLQSVQNITNYLKSIGR